MGFYSVRGLTGTAPYQTCLASLWNPHTTKRIKVLEIGMSLTIIPGGVTYFVLQRISARGTPGATITPDIQQGFTRDKAPLSGTILDMAPYSVQPTYETGASLGWQNVYIPAYGLIYPMPHGIIIPHGAGLAIYNPALSGFPISIIWFCWEE